MVHHVCLVQHNPYLVVVTSQSLNASSEFIADVELVGVKQQENSVNSLSEPLQHAYEVITSVCSLLLSAENTNSCCLFYGYKATRGSPENTRSVHDRNSLQDLGVSAGALESVEEGVAKL